MLDECLARIGNTALAEALLLSTPDTTSKLLRSVETQQVSRKVRYCWIDGLIGARVLLRKPMRSHRPQQ